MPSYPTSCGFPIPYNGGFKLAPKKALSSVTTESRNSRVKSLITNNVYVVNFTFTFSKQADRDMFRQWFLYEIGYGNMWFNASWLTEFGFVAGDWVFRFTNPISIDLTGYKDSFQATLLMGPKNINTVVSGVFVEQGIGGQYIDQDYPFGFEPYQCLDNLVFKRIIYSNNSTQKIDIYDYNGSNFTKVGGSIDTSTPSAMTVVGGMAMLKENRLAVVTNPAILTLRTFEYDGASWTQLGTGTTFAGIGNVQSHICRMSDIRVALADSFSQTLRMMEFNTTTNVWAQVGSTLSIPTYVATPNGQCSITYLSATRIALISGQGRLVAFDWNGSAWAQVGSYLQLVTASAQLFSISALNYNRVAIMADNNGNSYSNKMSVLTFDGSTWTLEAQSSTYTIGGSPGIVVFDTNKIAHLHYITAFTGAGINTVKYSSLSFIDEGNTINVFNATPQQRALTSYYIPS